MTELAGRAVEILRSYGDAACYEEMVQTLLRGVGEVLEAKELGVLIRNTRANLYMLAGEEHRMIELTARIPDDARDVLIHGTMAPERVQAVRSRFHLANVQPLVQYAYYGELPPEETEVEIRLLGMDALDFLYENYGHASREYLRGRVEDGVMIGAYAEGELAGFIGEHIEGSMGLLHVMPSFRRHHLGFALERADIRRTMLRGQTPFCQVVPANGASRSLQRRLSMTQAEGMLYWLTDDTF